MSKDCQKPSTKKLKQLGPACPAESPKRTDAMFFQIAAF
jgi:hypothetical protein